MCRNECTVAGLRVPARIHKSLKTFWIERAVRWRPSLLPGKTKAPGSRGERVPREQFPQTIREQRVPVLVPLPSAHVEHAAVDVDVTDAQPGGLDPDCAQPVSQASPVALFPMRPR